MKSKKGIKLFILLSLLFIYSIPVNAEETNPKNQDGIYYDADRVIIKENSFTRGVGLTLGEGILRVVTYKDKNPKAYAITTSYTSKKYTMSAMVGCIDMLGRSSYTPQKTLSNVVSVSSDEIVSPTCGCTFTGTHSIQDPTTHLSYSGSTRSSVD